VTGLASANSMMRHDRLLLGAVFLNLLPHVTLRTFGKNCVASLFIGWIIHLTLWPIRKLHYGPLVEKHCSLAFAVGHSHTLLYLSFICSPNQSLLTSISCKKIRVEIDFIDGLETASRCIGCWSKFGYRCGLLWL